MKIETYEIEEVSGEMANMAADSDALELIEKLGLNGQKKLSNKDTATRFPYPRLSAQQSVIFKALFPEKTEIHDFSQGIIPLRVLQVIAFCKDFPQTQHMQIWHSNSIKEDPILIGAPSNYSSEEYLLARWGDALPSFDELVQKAKPILRAKLELELKQAINKLQSFLTSFDAIVDHYVATADKPTWNIYD